MGWKKILASFTGALALAASLAIPFEGEYHVTYLDPPGIPSICFGHTTGVKVGDKATREQCVVYLKEDLQQKQAAVNRLLKRQVSPYVEGALIDFAYNAGEGNLAASSMLRKINAGDIRGGCEAFAACEILPDGRKSGWGCGFAQGLELNGLKKRRIAERDMCLQGVSL